MCRACLVRHALPRLLTLPIKPHAYCNATVNAARILMGQHICLDAHAFKHQHIWCLTWCLDQCLVAEV